MQANYNRNMDERRRELSVLYDMLQSVTDSPRGRVYRGAEHIRHVLVLRREIAARYGVLEPWFPEQ
jgi:hypothetical protein